MTRNIELYESPMLNEVDIAASNTTIFIVLLGMFYLDKNDRTEEKMLVSVVLLLILINVIFSVYWLLSSYHYWLSQSRVFVRNSSTSRLPRARFTTNL